jgi:CheY-like chemotaxis protein
MTMTPKILIVDDSSASRLMMSKIVKSILPKVEVVTAENGRTALLQIASGCLYDLIILDLGLPDIGGLKILDICKEIKISCPIVTISDESSQKSLKDSIELGASEYLTKPIMRAQFSYCLRKYVKIEEKIEKRKILIVDDEKINRLIFRR